jgi:hypothetical protein
MIQKNAETLYKWISVMCLKIGPPGLLSAGFTLNLWNFTFQSIVLEGLFWNSRKINLLEYDM